MTKPIEVIVLVAILAVSPARACTFGASDWSMMSDEEIVSTVKAIGDEPRLLAGQSGELPPAPPGYRYDGKHSLVPL